MATRVTPRLAERKVSVMAPAEAPKPTKNGNGKGTATISPDTALVVAEQSAANAESDEIVTIKVRPFDFAAKGSLFGFLDLQDAEFMLQDAIKAEDTRMINAGLKALINGMRPYLEAPDGEDLDTEMRKLSFNDLFLLAGSIRSAVPVPNVNGAPSTTGQKGRARRRRG
jgi:hypothetical protein